MAQSLATTIARARRRKRLRNSTSSQKDYSIISKEYRQFKVLFDYYGICYTIVRGYLFVRCPYHGSSEPIASVRRDGTVYHCPACRWEATLEEFVKRHERLRSREKATERLSEILQTAASRAGKGAGS